MKQKRLKTLLPTLREKDRYISFQIISEEPVNYSELEGAIWNQFMDFYGEYGVSKMSLWLMKNLYSKKKQIGVVRCNNKSVQKVIAWFPFLFFSEQIFFKIEVWNNNNRKD